MLASLRGTTTTTGLVVKAVRHEAVYQTGQRVSAAEMRTLNLTDHACCTTWNYTIQPRRSMVPSRARTRQTGNLLLNDS